MTSTTTDPKSLTLREAYFLFYDRSELAQGTLDRHDAELMRWEVLTTDPTVSEIDEAALLEFRQALVDRGLSPFTVNATLRSLKAILRRLGPQEFRNPYGLGILSRIPAVKPVREPYRKPRRIPLDNLTRIYVAMRNATHPRKWASPVDWWRCLLVMAWTTGLRKVDLLSLRFDQIDLSGESIEFIAEKTGKADTFPLHPVAKSHLERIWLPQGAKRDRVFCEYAPRHPGRIYRQLRELCESAGVKRFTLHDLRRTAATEIEAVHPGMGSRFLQHCPRSVTERSYLNLDKELHAAILSMPIPTGWKPGPKMTMRAVEKAMTEAAKIVPEEYVAPQPPPESLWSFQPGQWRFNGSPWFTMRGIYLRVLKAFVRAKGPLLASDLFPLAWPDGDVPSSGIRCLHGKIADVRNRLRKCLGLPEGFDPLPCIEYGNGGAFILHLPFELMQRKELLPR